MRTITLALVLLVGGCGPGQTCDRAKATAYFADCLAIVPGDVNPWDIRGCGDRAMQAFCFEGAR